MPDQQTDNIQKDPKDWKTGDEPATASQVSYIQTMATEAHKDVSTDNLTKADAALLIENLQQQTGRG